MPSTSHSLLNYLRVVIGAWRDDPRDDATLLGRFAESGEEAAFRVLVCRHGALVWQTCRRILGDTPDAEDTFQTTFLALARRAGQLRREPLAGWLHQVAQRAALDVRASARRRRNLEQHLLTAVRSEAGDASHTELYAALDEELVGLPERLRAPLILRYLEGKSQDEVAHILGCSRAVVRRRLTRAEAILRERLERRGLTVGVVSVAALLTSSVAVSAVPARLIGSTVRVALRSLSFPLPLEPFKIAAPMEGVMQAMLVTKVKLVAVLLGLTLCLAGGGVVAYQALAENAAEPPPPAGEARGEAETPGQPEAAARVDCYGDPLPAGALARMGTTRLYYGRGEPSRAFAFSPDGKTLATHIDYMTVCLWDSVTGKEIRRLTTKAVQGHIASLGFSPDGKTLITVNYNKMVCLWEVATGKFLRKQEYQGPKRRDVRCLIKVAFLPGSEMLVFGDFLKSVEEGKRVRGAYVWDLAMDKEICQLNRPLKRGEGERSTAFSPDGKLLATTVSEEKENERQEIERKAILSLWDVATGKEIRQLTFKDDCVHAATFSPDGKTLASAGDRNICVWEVATGNKIHLFSRAVQEDGAFDGPLTFSPDGKTLLGGRAGHLWDMSTGKKIRSFGCSERAQVALFSPDGKTLAVGDEVGAIRLWNVAIGKEIGPRKGFRGGIRSIAYSLDGKTLISLGEDKTVRLWEVTTGKEIRQLAKGSSSVAFSPGSKMLASTMGDGAFHLWDTATDKEIRQFQLVTAEGTISPKLATFSPDGKKLAARMHSGPTDLWVWEVDTGKKIYSLSTGNQDGPNAGLIAFSPDGRLLVVDGKDNTVSLWEMATGKRIGQMVGLKKLARPREEFFFRFLIFSPDSRILATSRVDDDKIRVWEVASGKEIWQLNGLKNNGYGYALAFSPDGRMLATAVQGANNDGSRDLKVHLWEMANGKEIGQLTGHQAIIRTLAFSPDGKTIASGSDDLTCLIWDVTPFMSRLKSALIPPLTLRTLSQEQLKTAWADLAKDPAKAYPAIWALQAVPAQAIPLLREGVQSVAPPADLQQLQRWIADLNDNSFAVREKAQREIKKLGESAIPALRQALKDQPVLEVKRRLQALLVELEPKEISGSPQLSRELRAVQVLESIGTPEARQMLQVWAKGVAEACLTQESQAALARLAKRSAARP